MASDAASRKWIEERIPHRAPFLFVDRVLDRGEDSIVTEWRVLPEADFFRGHYPGSPLLPGVLAAEFVFQSAALLICDSESARACPEAMPVLARISDARFRRAVRPGETITARVRLQERVGGAHHMQGEVANARGEQVLRLSFVVALTALDPAGGS